MYKSLTVIAFALIVLSGAMGLRNVAVANASTSANSSFTMQGRPFPPPGGGHMQGRPFPPPGGGHEQGRPFPPAGGGH
jgi:hypothetical protein